MQMGTRFRIIQGGKLVAIKTAASRGAAKPAGKPNHLRGRYRATRYKFDRESLWGLIFVALATFYGVWFLTGQNAEPSNAVDTSATFFTSDTESASFALCHAGGGTNCVVDGDTLYYQGAKIRIADIDTPETHPSRCAEEARLGNAATQRLQALVNAGPFSLQSIDRDEDAYGRKLRVITRGGQSIGQDLVDQGLARWYGGGRQSWC